MHNKGKKNLLYIFLLIAFYFINLTFAVPPTPVIFSLDTPNPNVSSASICFTCEWGTTDGGIQEKKPNYYLLTEIQDKSSQLRLY